MLTVNNLTIGLVQQNAYGRRLSSLVQDVSFTLQQDQCLGILGESGSGKSLICRAVNGLLDDSFYVEGSVQLNQRELLTLSHQERRHLRGEQISMIMQSPMTAFNPLFTIGNQTRETICSHRDITGEQAQELICESFAKVNLKNCDEILRSYPHQLSGGMLQRVMIALAFALQPKIIIADEPTTAIDYVSQYEVVKQLQALRCQCGTSFIFVSHDLTLVSHLADDILVMNAGQVIDYGSSHQIFDNPTHPHTRYLIDTRMRLLRSFRTSMGGASYAHCG